MSFLSFFIGEKKKTATVAKERLQMILMHERSDGASRLSTIPGMVPGLYDRPVGCLFAPRCAHAQSRCHTDRPGPTVAPQGSVQCHFPLNQSAALEVTP